jgi:hypothetical protein
MIARRVRAFDITELTLKAQVDDGIDIRRLEVMGVDVGVFAFDTVVVDGVSGSCRSTSHTSGNLHRGQTRVRLQNEGP